MTDDTILLLIITAILAIATLVMYFGIKRSMRKAEEARLKRERALEQLKAEREASWKRMAGQTYYKSTPTATKADSKTSSSKTYYAPQSSSSTDSDDLITAIILNQALNSNSGVVSARVDYTDSYTRVEVDDSPSKSSSWSSSSDIGSSSSWDSSSSSDSGSSSSWD